MDFTEMSAHIRIATGTDSSGIAATHVAAWRETYDGLLPLAMLANLSVSNRAIVWQKLLDQSNPVFSVAYVAEAQRSIVGFAHGAAQRTVGLKQDGFSGEITSIYVLKIYQQRGIGRILFRRLVENLVNNGHTSAALWVLQDNLNARLFYEKLEGEIVGVREEEREAATLIELAYGWRDLPRLLGI